jgi:CheY-like chemotaxis protein
MAPLVLVVDDDRDIRDSLIEALEEHGYRAAGASNGVEALAVLRGAPEPPSLILLDLMMPVMDGQGFREHQLADPSLAGIPVLVMSAYSDVEAQARRLGLDAMQKPFALRPLLDAVRQRVPT